MKNTPSILTKTLLTLAFAGLVAAFFAQPVAAQTASNLKCSGCIKSKQIKNGKIKGNVTVAIDRWFDDARAGVVLAHGQS